MSREVHVRFCESRGVRLPPATHLVVMCRSREQAEAALERLRVLLADLGLEPKAAKTRIVHLEEGGEGVDFLGFHHRLVRSRGTAGKRGVIFLARWPADKAMQHARDRIRQTTDRSRLLLAPEWMVEDLNRFLGGWAAYFRYGNSAARFDKISEYARMRLALHQQAPPPLPRVRPVGGGVCLTRPARADRLVGNRRRPQALPGLAGEAECRR